MGCGSVVQNPGPLGLFDAHAGNEPSALHVQNQVQPFSTNLALLPLLPPFLNEYSPLQPPAAISLSPVSLQQYVPKFYQAFMVQPKKYQVPLPSSSPKVPSLLCITPPPRPLSLSWLFAFLSALSSSVDVLVFVCPCCLVHSRPSGCWLA